MPQLVFLMFPNVRHSIPRVCGLCDWGSSSAGNELQLGSWQTELYISTCFSDWCVRMGVKISWTGWRRESLSIPWLLISLSGSLTCGHSDDLVYTENWKITRSHFRLAAFTRWLHTQHVIYEAGWAQTIGGKRAADQCMGKTHFIANGLFALTQTQTQRQAQPLRPVSTTLSARVSSRFPVCLFMSVIFISRD